MPDLDDTIEMLATEPQAASVDGQSVTSRSIDDVIKADQYLSAKEATSDGRSAWGKVRMAKGVMPRGGPH